MIHHNSDVKQRQEVPEEIKIRMNNEAKHGEYTNPEFFGFKQTWKFWKIFEKLFFVHLSAENSPENGPGRAIRYREMFGLIRKNVSAPLKSSLQFKAASGNS